MRNRIAGLAVVALTLLVSATPNAGQARPGTTAARPAAAQAKPAAAPAQKLPPLSYICTMPGDEDVLEDKPGSCPKCKMDLVAVRLDAKWWCPVHQANEVYDGPGKCRRDGRDLVQVTLSESWTCADTDKKFLEPGKCGDGSARKIAYELRAHGDHNPRHGGQFFMASDAWHHIEGTYPQNGLVRVFFYDNFTKPFALRGKGITGSVVVRDAKDNEVATVPLAAGGATSMEAKIPAASAALPLRVTVKMKFGAKIAEQPFDFQFNEYSKDAAPAGTAIGPTSTPRPPVAPAAPKPAAAPTVAAAAPQAPVATPQGEPNRFQPPPGNPNDPLSGEIAPMPPALAAMVNEEVLPKDVAGLLKELSSRSGDIDRLMKEGNIGEVWLPAMGTKTVALVLEGHSSTLPAARRARATLAARQIVAGAWELDGYGDLGNRAKVAEAWGRMEKAVAELKAAFEGGQ